MRQYFIVALTALALVGCSSLLTPTIDEQTGTTLAQRCVDYRASLAAYDVASQNRELSEAETVAVTVLRTWIAANCPPVTEVPVEGSSIVERKMEAPMVPVE